MADNVIIFGAGASFDAGIPLLSNFVEKMWEFSIRGTGDDGKPISEEDRAIFKKARLVRDELSGYHRSANFDDSNLEDILSMLSFNEMMGGRGKSKLTDFIRAISRTIELTCNVKHDGKSRIQETGSKYYRRFWQALILRHKKTGKLPALITFNYDLVLERALFQVLNSVIFRDASEIGFDGLNLKYCYDDAPLTSFGVGNARYELDFESMNTTPGLSMNSEPPVSTVDIELFKLHGSLNFSRNKVGKKRLPVHALEDPFILPPIFNKMSSGKSTNKMWSEALNCLRNAKHLIIVGYSMPQTDIYMQYFLKTALGPNVDLNRIYIFNPLLFSNCQESKEMEERYASCFAQQLRNRIVFRPNVDNVASDNGSYKGTFRQFVAKIMNESILF